MNDIPKVKVISDGLLQNTHILVGDKELRVVKATITIEAGERVKLSLETYVDLVDVKVLEKDTELIIKDLLHEAGI